MGEGVQLTKQLHLLLLLLLLLVPMEGQGRKVRGVSRGREESRGGIQGGLAELLGGLLPNTYYSRPNYRYPYYDKTGKVLSLIIILLLLLFPILFFLCVLTSTTNSHLFLASIS